MITFDMAIPTAKRVIQRWNGYANLSEITIIRDVFGRLGFLLSGTGNWNIRSLAACLQRDLGPYNAQRIFVENSTNNELTKQMIAEIKRLRTETDSTPSCKWYLLERTIAKKAWTDFSGRTEPIWSYDDAKDGKQPKVITFYSFKGGMGRTTALAATAMLLARHGRHVLMIDTDVEAPGLATLFFDETQILRGTVDFYLEATANGGTAPNLSRYLRQINDPNLTAGMTGKLYMIPAGSLDTDYVQKLGRIDYQDMIPNGMRDHLTLLVKSAADFIRTNSQPLDYILLDARAGFHDMGGIVTTQLPHGAVLFGRNSTQSWNGLQQVIYALATAQQDRLPIAIVDSMSRGTEQHKQDFKRRAFTLCCDKYYAPDEPQPSIDAENEAHTPIYISYAPGLNEEVKLYSDGSPEQEAALEQTKSILCGEEYRLIESRIRLWFGDEEEKEATEVDGE